MKQNRKFIPMIALGLTALLSVGNAVAPDWSNDNVLYLSDFDPVFSSTEKKQSTI